MKKKHKKMSILSKESIQDLIENQRMEIQITTSDLVERIIPLFKNLTMEHPMTRQKWLVDLSGDKHDPDDGLIERKGEGSSDQKFFFHYRPDLLTHLLPQLTEIKYGDLFNACAQLHDECTELASQIISEFDDQFPVFDIKAKYLLLPEDRRNVLRLLLYKPGNDILAKAHCDKAFATLCLGESHPGLFLDKATTHYAYKQDTALCFFGKKAEIVSGSRFKATPHYVKAFSSEWRWAVVFFIHIQVDMPDSEIEKGIDKEKNLYQY